MEHGLGYHLLKILHGDICKDAERKEAETHDTNNTKGTEHKSNPHDNTPTR